MFNIKMLERMVFMEGLQKTCLIFSIIGAIVWGLIGFFNFNLVSLIFGNMTWLSRIIYALVGICGIYLLTFYSFIGDVRDDA